MQLLSIKNLTVTVGEQKILDGVGLEMPQGQILGIAGGSGSGKTTLAFSILKLLPPAMRMPQGEIIFDGRNIASHTGEQMRALRGKDIGMVFQEPLSAFDPLFTIGAQLDETLAAHTNLDTQARLRKSLDTLASVEIEDPQRIYRSFAHQLSGGLRQRAMIAQAIVCGPKLIIADEPTSSLDVTIQAKIIKLLRRLNQEQGVGIILISHDLNMLGVLAHETAVMSQGAIVEKAAAADILRRPRHPYTKALIEANTP